MISSVLAGYTLEDILPHRKPMLLIDDVLAVDSKQAKTLSVVKSDWPLTDAQGVHPLILIEIAAQAVGVCNGWERIHTQGIDSNQMGWLVGVKKADIEVDTISLGTGIIALAQNSFVFESFREADCELFIAEQRVARVALQIFQK